MQKTSLNSYYERVHKHGLIFLLLHLPVFFILSKYFETEVSIALGLSSLLIGFQWAIAKFSQNKSIPIALFGFTIIAFSGILIHLGKGMIEWHFHIFVSIGLLCYLGNVKTILAAALTAAVHHVAFYFVLPESIFNYEASFGIVAIHASFVVLQTIAACYITYKYQTSLVLQDKMVTEFGPIVEFLNSTTQNNNDMAHKINDSVAESGDAMTQISETFTEIASMAERTSDSCLKAVGISKDTETYLAEGDKVVTQINASSQNIKELQKQLEELQKATETRLNEVVNSVTQVIEKTDLINDIVFQTKLLSFNASVEAARAGEHGKGFAVVAEEIGALATNSGEASIQISELVQSSQEILKESVDTIHNGFSKAQTEFDHTTQNFVKTQNLLNSSFKNIRNGADELNKLVNSIQNAADEQTKGSKELSDALYSVKNKTQIINSESKNILQLANDSSKEVKRVSELYDEVNSIIKNKSA